MSKKVRPLEAMPASKQAYKKESRTALFFVAALKRCSLFPIRTFFDTHGCLLSFILFLQTKHYEIERSDPYAFF